MFDQAKVPVLKEDENMEDENIKNDQHSPSGDRVLLLEKMENSQITPEDESSVLEEQDSEADASFQTGEIPTIPATPIFNDIEPVPISLAGTCIDMIPTWKNYGYRYDLEYCRANEIFEISPSVTVEVMTASLEKLDELYLKFEENGKDLNIKKLWFDTFVDANTGWFNMDILYKDERNIAIVNKGGHESISSFLVYDGNQWSYSSTPNESVEWLVYENQYYNYSFEIPKNWIIGETGQNKDVGKSEIIGFGPPGVGDFLFWLNTHEETSIEEAIDKMLNVRDYSLVRTEPFAEGNISGEKAIYINKYYEHGETLFFSFNELTFEFDGVLFDETLSERIKRFYKTFSALK